jgi:hypothetical protein
MKKTVKKVEEKVEEKVVDLKLPDERIPSATPRVINPITQEFGNGEMNILRDKINELITNR